MDADSAEATSFADNHPHDASRVSVCCCWFWRWFVWGTGHELAIGTGFLHGCSAAHAGNELVHVLAASLARTAANPRPGLEKG